MNDQELLDIWKTQESKMDEVLEINKHLVFEVTKSRLQKTIGKLRRPKFIALFIGIPYTILICAIAVIAFLAGGIFHAIGFGAIALIMTLTVCLHGHQLYLINQINGADEIQHVQERLSKLHLSSYNCIRLAVVQLPFWSICWISMDALLDSPLIYGGVNLLVLGGLTYLAYFLYTQLSPSKPHSKVRQFFLSGSDPLTKSADILEQLRHYA